MKKIGVSWIVVAFVIGIITGSLGGALFITWKVIRFETDAMVQAVAESTFSLTTVVVALNNEDSEDRLRLFESGARLHLNAGVVRLHASLPLLSDKKRERITDILYSIANKREKLKIGRFDSPPKDHIEAILATYYEW